MGDDVDDIVGSDDMEAGVDGPAEDVAEDMGQRSGDGDTRT